VSVRVRVGDGFDTCLVESNGLQIAYEGRMIAM